MTIAEDLYARQIGAGGLTRAGQAKLASARVLVAGIGGVGGTVATYLAAAGVGRLDLVHPGPLDPEDLNRQTLMRPDDLGTPRVAAAARTLAEHYPSVRVDTHDTGVDDPVVAGLVAAADVVVDARHNFPERRLLNRLCRAAGRPEVAPAMSGTDLQLTTCVPDGPCWSCVFPSDDGSWQPLGFRVLGAVAGTVGCLAATEVVKLLAGIGTPLAGRLLHADLAAAEFRTFRIRRRPGCPDCAGGGASPR